MIQVHFKARSMSLKLVVFDMAGILNCRIFFGN